MKKPNCVLRVLAVALLMCMCAAHPAWAQPSPPTEDNNQMLNSWPFADTNWLSSAGYPPVSFTNIQNVSGGDGDCLWLDTTNTTPAFLFYNVVETNGFTNLICSTGSISLWFMPDWFSTNLGGTGPGNWGNLISLGQAGTNGPWWSWFISPDGCTVYFSSQTNGGTASNYLAAPVSLAEGEWVNLFLTYSATNSAFYTNGVLVTNGTGVAYWPGPDVTFFSIGSDSNGLYQAGGKFDDVQTYNYGLDTNMVAGTYGMYSILYLNTTGGVGLSHMGSASPSAPSGPAPRWFTGNGYAQYVTNASLCVTNANVWLTNVSATILSNGTTAITFTIEGGSNSVAYDIFGTTAIVLPKATNAQWAWLGQGYQCGVYTITNLSYSAAFLMLGTARDSDGDGLTDAFEGLVSKTSPTKAYTFGNLPDAWIALNGLVGSSTVATQDPDLDGLNNFQEYLYGSKPLVNEGTNIFVASPATINGI